MSEQSSAKANRRAEEERDLRERKKYNTIVIVTVAVLAVLVVFAILFSSDLFYNRTTAVEIGGMDFTVADFNYNYFTAYNNQYNTYYQYAQYGIAGLLPVSGTPFDEQVYTTTEDGEEITWADYFEDQAIEMMRQVAMLCTEAEKEGFALPQEELDAIEETVQGMTSQAAAYGYPNLEGYLVQLYGKGMTEEVFRRNLERQSLAAAYQTHKRESFTYTDDQLKSHYAEHSDEYDYLIYRSYKFSGAAVTDDENTEEDETLSLDDAMAKAETEANAFKAAVTNEQAFMDYAASLNEETGDYDADSSTIYKLQGSTVKSSIDEEVYNWLVDPARKEGDVTVIGTEKDASSPGYYVLYFIKRDNNQYESVNGWYGYIPETTDVFEEGAEPEDADEKAEAIKTVNLGYADEILEQYNSGEHLLDNFKSVLTDSENEELVTNNGELSRFGFYDGPDDVCAWLFDPARQEGDTGAIYVEGDGTYILYFSGNDDIYADAIADTAMRSDDTNTWFEEQIKSYTADKQWEMILTKKMASLN